MTSDGGGDPDPAVGSDVPAKALWAQVLGGSALRSTADGTDGYRDHSFGLVFGGDHQISPDILAGVALSWVRGFAQGVDGSAGNATKLDSYQMTGYGTYRQEAAFVDGQLGFGFNQYSQSRRLDAFGSTAGAKFGGRQYLAKATVGYDVAAAGVVVTPLAGLQWIRAVNDGYSESGAGQADLTVDARGFNALSSELGGKVVFTAETDWGPLSPDIKVTWGHDYTRGPIATSGLLGGATFATTAARPSPDGAKLSLGTTLEQKDGLSLRLEYDGELRAGYQSHVGLIRLRMEF